MLALAVLLLGGVAGIGWIRTRTEPVRVSNVPTPSRADEAACRRLADLLPATIGDGLKTRTVHPASPLLHAWGKPAAVLRCGVGYPPNLTADSAASEIDGVTWFNTPADDSVIFSTLDRVPRVSLAIPRTYPIPFDLLVSLSAAIRQATVGS